MNSKTSASEDVCPRSGELADLQRFERWKRTEEGRLFPNVPDEITINHILPRLSWRSWLLLCQVNRTWQSTLRNPDIYDVRSRAASTQTIVTIHQYECKICLYDTSTETWHLLPHPPFGGMMVALGCSCVCVHGKVYILGGNRASIEPRNEVHMFDLTGQGQWKQCASMKTARKHFACGVHNGRIFVFGGIGAGSASEVYDPKENLWHDITPMLSPRIEHKLVKVANKFCIYSMDNHYNLKWGYSHFAEIYDPSKDQWMKVENFTKINSSSREMMAEAAVLIDGRLHRILDDWLYVYEEPGSSSDVLEPLRWDGSGLWRPVQKISWDIFQCSEAETRLNPFARSCGNPFSRASLAIPDGGELLALVFGQTATMNLRKWTLLKSEGLGCNAKELIWKRIQCTLGALPQAPVRFPWIEDGVGFPFSPCMCTIAGSW